MKGKSGVPVWLLFLAVVFLMAFGGCRGEDSGAYDRGMEALKASDYDTAMEEFQTAANEDGRKAEAYRGEGIIYLKRQDYEHAATLFGLSLDAMEYQNEEFREDVLYYQAEAYAGAGRIQEAEAVYRQLETGSDPGLAFFRQGQICLDRGSMDSAKELFAQALEQDGSYEMYIRIYEACADVSREADGAVYLRTALELTPSDGEDYYSEGLIHYYLENYDQARISLNNAVEAGKEDARLLLGKICLETEDVAGARVVYQQWLEENEKAAPAYNGLALCDIAEGNYDSALVNIETGLSCGGAEEELLFNEIVVYEYKLDFETAKEKMQEFLEKYPDNEEAVRENMFLQSR